MKKLVLALAAIGLSILLTMPANAFGPREGRMAGRGYQAGDRCGGYYGLAGLNKLNLSAEQKARIESLREAHIKDVRPLREKMFDKSVELRKLWLEATPDRNKITVKQKEVRALRNQLEDKKTVYRFEINKVLTKDQKEKLATSGWNKKSGFGPRGGKRGPHGPGGCF